uniref:RING-type domain-containing protein n=1 Tax=Lepisosteus oculatus TaxID=7918 RepID=W5LWL6_LEPOC
MQALISCQYSVCLNPSLSPGVSDTGSDLLVQCVYEPFSLLVSQIQALICQYSVCMNPSLSLLVFQMQALISCQCTVCSACFQQHFTIAVRDKHIRDMVCPVCGEPDINNQDQFNSYFSTLDIQLRDCLDSEVYELFHKKLTE